MVLICEGTDFSVGLNCDGFVCLYVRMLCVRI